MNHLESKLQISCITWFRYQYPQLEEILIAVPNGGARGKLEATIMKKEGVTAGVSDLLLLTPKKGFGALCIEMKIGKGKQSQSQVNWQKKAERHGNKYILCRNMDDFMSQVADYLR